MKRWIVRAYEPWDSHRTHNGRTEEREDESGKWYKADEVDAEIEKVIIEYQTEITRLRKILKGRCTEEEWREI